MPLSNNQYRVDLELLDEAISLMSSFTADVDIWIDEIDGHITNLHLSWTGDAADAQRAAHDRWLAGLKRMRADLDDLRVAARRAQHNYSDAVTTNTRIWPE